MPLYDQDPLDAAPEGVAASLVNAFRQQAEDIVVETSVGVTLYFGHHGQFSSIRSLYQDAEKFVKNIPAFMQTKEEWKPYANAKRDDLLMAYVVASMSKEPTKLTTLDAVKIAVEAGPIFAEILYAINNATNYRRVTELAEEVEEAKKD